MDDYETRYELGEAIEEGDVETVNDLLSDSPELAGFTLVVAARIADTDMLELSLSHGADPNEEVPQLGGYVLHNLLDQWFRLESLEWLLANGADPNLQTGELRETPLYIAAKRFRTGAIEPLIEAGARVDLATKNGMTPWRHAMRRGFEPIATALAGAGADTTLTPSDELAIALGRNDLAGARAVLEKNPTLVSTAGPEEARLLPDLAGRNNAREAIEFLIHAGADLEVRGVDGGTALHQTAWFGQPETAELLIQAGAQIDTTDDVHRSTPIGWVAHGSTHSDGAEPRAEVYARVAVILLEAGASLAHPTRPEEDPRGGWLLEDASPEVAEVLFRYGAEPLEEEEEDEDFDEEIDGDDDYVNGADSDDEDDEFEDDDSDDDRRSGFDDEDDYDDEEEEETFH